MFGLASEKLLTLLVTPINHQIMSINKCLATNKSIELHAVHFSLDVMKRVMLSSITESVRLGM